MPSGMLFIFNFHEGGQFVKIFEEVDSIEEGCTSRMLVS